MSPSNAIIVVANDRTLLRSLEFALEAEGFSVEAHDSWRGAASTATPPLCTVVDGEVVQKDRRAREALRDPAARIVVLADGLVPLALPNGVIVLTKPFQGSELLAAISSFPGSLT